MKKWLSRGIVLAMVMALMIPAPVLAKSSKSGGKLVKSVTYYEYDNGNWGKRAKQTYTYDKKNNPKEIKTTTYDGKVIPLWGESTSKTFKYKYKGKTPKSAVVRSAETGLVVENRSYRKGKLAVDSIFGFDEDNKPYTRTFGYTYTKSGLATSVVGPAYYASSHNHTWTYGMAQKKGIPSQIVSTEKCPDSETPYAPYYSFYGKKGLLVEGGYYDDNVYNKDYMVTYTYKKGNVKTAVIYSDDNESGKLEPVAMVQFEYNKTKISKKRYMNMINSFVTGAGYYGDRFDFGAFNWY